MATDQLVHKQSTPSLDSIMTSKANFGSSVISCLVSSLLLYNRSRLYLWETNGRRKKTSANQKHRMVCSGVSNTNNPSQVMRILSRGSRGRQPITTFTLRMSLILKQFPQHHIIFHEIILPSFSSSPYHINIKRCRTSWNVPPPHILTQCSRLHSRSRDIFY